MAAQASMDCHDREWIDRVIDRLKQAALPGTLIEDLRLVDVANSIRVKDVGVGKQPTEQGAGTDQEQPEATDMFYRRQFGPSFRPATTDRR
jgi:hypothetical protein